MAMRDIADRVALLDRPPRVSGGHPAGIAGRQREHVLLAAFDVRGDLPALLTAWTDAERRPGPCEIALGVGPSLFDERFGLAGRRPARLRRLPAFAGDALEPERSDGDLVVTISAERPHDDAAAAAARPRWTQRFSEQDALSAHVTHTGSAVFAIPPPGGLLSLR